ncbi:SagB/ThcOx family dehydrogenase [Candidatus Woesearchaeota archaeon]|nr:SagB/ThcOx family dehydrogenase [Candidatus Woesearchaeota archaeon]
MLREIKEFYEKTKLREQEVIATEQELPVTFVHIFHKKYPRFPSIQLPMCGDGQLEILLSKRRSVREFSGKPINFQQVSYTLHSCGIVSSNGNFERRTYPSAGARFPIEIYLISFNVDGLKQGAYHYDVLDHVLEILWEQDLNPSQHEIVSSPVKNSSAAIVLTSVIARTEVKYGHKAYPFSLLEAGHIGQNIQLACADHGIGCCPVGGFVNDKITKILDLTADEIPLYVLALGSLSKNDNKTNS